MKDLNKLTKEEMLGLLPDYAFESLDKEQRELFESNLVYFPELADELVELRSVFAKINPKEIKVVNANSARNISVSVMNKLTRKTSYSLFNTKVLVPAGVFVILALIFIPSMFREDVDFSDYEIPPIFLDEGSNFIFDSETVSSDFSDIEDEKLIEAVYTDDFYEYDELDQYDSNLFELIEIEKSTSYDFTILNNEDFEQLYEDLQNVTLEF